MSNKQNGITSTERVNRVLNVGYGNFVVAGRIVAVLESGSLPMKRLREKASESGLLVDATAGRKMRSLIITDSKHVVVSALSPQSLSERLVQHDKGSSKPYLSPAEMERQDGEFVS
jgi:extracellular matrix regulatory protein A